MKSVQLMEKDSEIAAIMEENQGLTTRVKEKESRCEKLTSAFDSLSVLHKRSADENWELTVNRFCEVVTIYASYYTQINIPCRLLHLVEVVLLVSFSCRPERVI